jgi:hypothetical protein
VAQPQQLRDLARQARHISRRFRRHGDVVQLRQVQQPLRRGVRHVDRVELIVAGRRLHDPGGARDDADDFERLVPKRDGLPDGIGAGAKQAIDDHLAEHDHLRAAILLPFGEEAAAGEGPGALDRRHHHVGAVHAREPALLTEMHARILVDAAGDILHAVHLADGVGIVERHRRAEPRPASRSPSRWRAVG